uniref:thiamine-phosphate kinase n=1 Tax=Parerythrobacter lutipelagi TaxID=1964208 RepID=UPI0010F62A5E|nr:thiamine-phosphate kinase [Parerythrobacter lutipelagi]
MSGELEFIARLRALATHPAARNLEDDAAVLEFGSETLVLTQDSMAEGTHWLEGTDPYDIAWKLVAANLSDLAAKGAQPLGVLLSYSLGSDDARFIEGLQAVLGRYDVPLLGGDTIAAAGPRTLALTAIGRATHTPPPSRSGASVGDTVWLCGTIGDAKRGFDDLTAGDRAEAMGFARSTAKAPDPYFVEKFLRPKPLLAEGIALAPVVTAMMDVSDGLFLDVQRMAVASRVAIDIDFDAIPFSARFMRDAAEGNQLDVLSRGYPVRRAAAGWGDDYALLFTLPAGANPPVEASRIGQVLPQDEHSLLIGGKPPSPDETLGYEH